MNILMASVFFYPHIGGIESVTEFLADEFTRMGHNVTVITRTTETGDKQFSYKVLRNPSKKELWNAYCHCDVFVHQGISLLWVWPLLLKRKPWFIVYHGTNYQKGYLGYLKKLCSYFANNIAVSETTAHGYRLHKASVIYNSYNNSIFKNTNSAERTGFVFLGRLQKEKGCYVLLDAFEKFKQATKSDFRLTFVGDGPDKTQIEIYSRSLSSHKDIHFTGFKYAKEAAEILNQNKILIVPSTYIEAFGIVVLEGLACGCIVIGSDSDGIEEALGDNGFLFKKGNVDELCQKMKDFYSIPHEDCLKLQEKANKWLDYLSLRKVAIAYIDEFNKYIN